jgi:hypothetical protein
MIASCCSSVGSVVRVFALAFEGEFVLARLQQWRGVCCHYFSQFFIEVGIKLSSQLRWPLVACLFCYSSAF